MVQRTHERKIYRDDNKKNTGPTTAGGHQKCVCPPAEGAVASCHGIRYGELFFDCVFFSRS